MSRVFIDRPIFAWVIAIIIMLGDRRDHQLPIAQYPDVAPPQVNIRASYPGASAQTLQDSVTQVLEQQLTGLDGLIYFQSSSSSRGQATINVTFEKGTDPDIAQVQVQNEVQPALSRLPQQVQQQGVRVTKSSNDFLLIIGVYDETGRRPRHGRFRLAVEQHAGHDLPDPRRRRRQRVRRALCDAHLARSGTSSRLLLLMPGDVISAISARMSRWPPARSAARRPLPGQMLNATVTASSRFQTPEQFRNIIVKADPAARGCASATSRGSSSARRTTIPTGA